MRAVIVVPDRDSYPLEAIISGCHRMGYSIQNGGNMIGDIAVTWTPWRGSMREHIGEAHKRAGRPWIVFENGYIRGEESTYSAALYGFNGHGEHRMVRDERRWHSMGLVMKPKCQNRDGHILVIGQFGHHDTRYSMPLHWPDAICQSIRCFTHRSIVFRPKPQRPRGPTRPIDGMRISGAGESLEALIAGAYVTVVWNSKQALQSLLMGVPVVVCGDSVGDPLCEKDIGKIEEPFWPPEAARMAFFEALASAVYTKAEIAAGEPVKRLCA